MKYLVLLLALAACAPRTVIEPQEVKIPVAIPCTPTLPPEPVWLSPLVKNGTHADKVKAMAKDLNAAHAYIGIQKAAIDGCK